MITVNDVLAAEVAYTHAGQFHADDVFSSALLRMINPDIKIIRTFNPPEDAVIVFDVGGGEYDHHGEKEFREWNPDCPYAAFGKLWRSLGLRVADDNEDAAFSIEKNLVSEVDWTDNVGNIEHPNTLNVAIAAFNPDFLEIEFGKDHGIEESEIRDKAFEKALDVAKEILFRFVKTAVDKANLEALIPDRVAILDGIMMMDAYIPWKDYADSLNVENDGEVKFGIYPSMRGGWNVERMQKHNNPKEAYADFPVEWRGKRADELPDGVTFCHASGFLTAFETKEDAVRYTREAIRKAIDPYSDFNGDVMVVAKLPN